MASIDFFFPERICPSHDQFEFEITEKTKTDYFTLSFLRSLRFLM
jgi:hypothetical protein